MPKKNEEFGVLTFEMIQENAERIAKQSMRVCGVHYPHITSMSIKDLERSKLVWCSNCGTILRNHDGKITRK